MNRSCERCGRSLHSERFLEISPAQLGQSAVEYALEEAIDLCSWRCVAELAAERTLAKPWEVSA